MNNNNNQMTDGLPAPNPNFNRQNLSRSVLDECFAWSWRHPGTACAWAPRNRKTVSMQISTKHHTLGEIKAGAAEITAGWWLLKPSQQNFLWWCYSTDNLCKTHTCPGSERKSPSTISLPGYSTRRSGTKVWISFRPVGCIPLSLVSDASAWTTSWDKHLYTGMSFRENKVGTSQNGPSAESRSWSAPCVLTNPWCQRALLAYPEQRSAENRLSIFCRA